MFNLLIINMFNSNINLFGTLLSHDGWSGDTATGRRRVTSQGWKGRKSDLTLFKETTLEIHPKIKVKGDLGYLGINKIHERSKVPHKKPINGELTKKQKKQNKQFRKKRVRIEHVNRTCKCFRMVKETYRNRLNHIAQVWLIVCGLVNLNL